jgi:hypothetical protein
MMLTESIRQHSDELVHFQYDSLVKAVLEGAGSVPSSTSTVLDKAESDLIPKRRSILIGVNCGVCRDDNIMRRKHSVVCSPEVWLASSTPSSSNRWKYFIHFDKKTKMTMRKLEWRRQRERKE